MRVPPDHLDVLVLKLRALGDLIGQKVTADDITQQYTDLNSELRADRAMEERLLDLIKDGKGQIKDLLAAEKELGEWRQKIEKVIGQLNRDDNLAALATLQITLTEKDIHTAALACRTETVGMSVQSDDVAKARDSALSAIEDARGRIIDSELKQLDAGQFTGTIIADVPPSAAGTVIDRIRQLGTVSRLDIQRAETTTDGHGNPIDPSPVRTTQPSHLHTEDKDTRLTLSLYNLANVAPRQTTVATVACDDVEHAYHAILDHVTEVGGRVLNSNLDSPRPREFTALIAFEIKTGSTDALVQKLRSSGEVMQMSVTENPDTNNVTASKHGFSVTLRSLASVNPREVRTLSLATPDVSATYAKLLSTLSNLKPRIVMSKLDREESQPSETAGYLDFVIDRPDADAVERLLADQGDTYQRTLLQSADVQNTLESELQFKLNIHNANLLPPLRTQTLTVETSDVESAQSALVAETSTEGGRVVDSTVSKQPAGQMTAHLVLELPVARSAAFLDRIKHVGDVRSIESTNNPQFAEGKLSRVRFELTLGTPEALVGQDRGLASAIRSGLATSIAGLLWSLQLVVIGLCFVLPWAALIALVWKFLHRRRARVPSLPAVTDATMPTT